MYIYIYIYISHFVFRSFDDRVSKSPPGAGHAEHQRAKLQTIQTIAAFTSSTIHTADTTSCAGHERKGLTPSDQWAISNPPTHRRSGSQAHGQCQLSGQLRSASKQKRAPMHFAQEPLHESCGGCYPPARSPPGSPGQWLFSSTGAHNGHTHRRYVYAYIYIYIHTYANT